MKRLLRWLLRGLAVLSLLVCATTVVFWVRSYRTGDTLIIAHCSFRDNTHVGREWAIVMGNGVVKFSRETRSYTNPPPTYLVPTSEAYMKLIQPGWHVTPCVNPPNWVERSFNGAWNPIGFRYSSQASTEYYDEKGGRTVERWADRTFRFSKSAIFLRCWLVVTLTSIPAGGYVLRRLFHRTPPAGRCKSCGYDLRASKDRCPECGTPFPPAHLATSRS